MKKRPSVRGVARIFEWGGTSAEGAEGGRVRGRGSGEGAVPPPQKIFDYLTLKWCILVRI